MSKLHTVKGFADLYPDESRLYTLMEGTARCVFGAYGYGELRTPLLEYTELFQRSIGAETDVVQKEMYTFPDRKGRSLTLRPEATAGIMRSYIEHSFASREAVSKFFTCGPMFRYERPQKGRLRQFHQLNCECLGAQEPQVDAEIILMLMHFLHELGLTELQPEMNSLGCRNCRPAYREALTAFLRRIDPATLCEDCRRRMESNPMRVLDCKVPGCRKQTDGAPDIREHLCAECDSHFKEVLAILDREGLTYTLNPRLVRGLDYYVRTTFEVMSTSIGAQGSVAGGGRYDGLVAELGGPDIPGIGYACGMERLAMMLADKQREADLPRPDFYVAVLCPEAANVALHASQKLRRANLQGEMSFESKSLKSQLRQASRVKAEYCIMLGENELAQKSVIIKHMDSGDQVIIPLATLSDWAEIRYEDKMQRYRKGSTR